jgi:nicotinamidase/pyrazinamidase
MQTSGTVLWCVDMQQDFVRPGGKLYVPGAERLLPTVRQLTDAARHGRCFLVSHGCFHTPDDPEFSTFPPHCIKGTAGAEFVPEVLTDSYSRVANDVSSSLPNDFLSRKQVILEKQTLDIFETRNANEVVERLAPDAEFLVFGVVTEYCVRLAAKGLLARGKKVSVVQDAIETLNREVSETTLSELRAAGAKLIDSREALSRVAVLTQTQR